MSSMLDKFHTCLKTNGYSSTKARQLVFLALLNEEPVSITSLIKKLNNSADRASIYRIVQLFEKIGVVQRLQIGWKYKLELSDSFASHHHHMSCTKCAKIILIPETTELENLITTLTEKERFQHHSHQLEISGLCQKCSEAISG